jgi:hypothetical protein
VLHALLILFHPTLKLEGNSYSVFVGKPGGKNPLGVPRCNWQDNIKMDVR